jgi:hypothetical protein
MYITVYQFFDHKNSKIDFETFLKFHFVYIKGHMSKNFIFAHKMTIVD